MTDKNPIAMIELLSRKMSGDFNEQEESLDVMKKTKDTISFIQGIKNAGVIESNGEETWYKSLTLNKEHFQELGDMIMVLSRELVKENMKLFNNNIEDESVKKISKKPSRK